MWSFKQVRLTHRLVSATAGIWSSKITGFKVIEMEWRVETYSDRSEKETIIFDGKGNLKEGK